MQELLRGSGVALLLTVIAFGAIYLTGSFVGMSWNITEWSDKFGRFLMIVGSVGFGVFITTVLYETEILGSNDNRSQ